MNCAFEIVGTLTADALREKLRTTMRVGDKDSLQNVISECVAAGMPELDSVIQEARRNLSPIGYAGIRGGCFMQLN